MKTLSKKHGCTINSIALAVTSVALHEYFTELGDDKMNEVEVPESLQLISPVSIRQTANSLETIEMTNDLSAIIHRLHLRGSFGEALAIVKKNTPSMLRSLVTIYGNLWALKLNMLLPSFISEWINNRVSNYNTMAFINLNATKVPYSLDGKQMNGASFYYAVSKGTVSASMIFLTCATYSSVTVFADKNKIESPEKLTSLVKKQIKLAL